jgi:hypothetical protein
MILKSVSVPLRVKHMTRSLLRLTVLPVILLALILACGPATGPVVGSPDVTVTAPLTLDATTTDSGDTTPTLAPVCTPPACAIGEEYYCPGDCPGGCGTICTTVVPGSQTTILNPAGPWLVYLSAQPDSPVKSIYASDGMTSVILVSEQNIVSPSIDFKAAVAPVGGHVAFITASDDYLHNLTLHLLTLPSGEVTEITKLTSPESEPEPGTDPMIGTDNFEAARAMTDVTSLAWSPDGTRLAFMGAMDGSSSDLHVYDLNSGEITQLTDGPSNGITPSWSPDGHYIVHFGVGSLGTGAGWGMEGAWAVDTTNGEVIDLFTPELSGEEVIDWIDDETVLVASWFADCGRQQLRTIHIPTVQSTILREDCFEQAAFAPEAGQIAFTAGDYFGTSDSVPGVHLIDIAAQEARQVSDLEASSVAWYPQLERFVAGTGSTMLVISPDGTVEEVNLFTELPTVSPDGTAWAWFISPFNSPPGLWIGPANTAVEPTQVFTDAVPHASWSPDGKYLMFFGGGNLYAIPRDGFDDLATVALQPLMQMVYPSGVNAAAWTTP